MTSYTTTLILRAVFLFRFEDERCPVNSFNLVSASQASLLLFFLTPGLALPHSLDRRLVVVQRYLHCVLASRAG